MSRKSRLARPVAESLECRTLLSAVVAQNVVQPVPGGSIAGILWNDSNSNGVKDAAESALVGWTVYLDQNRNGLLDAGEAKTTTSAAGAYSFNGLAAGSYVIADVLPAGYRPTAPASVTWPVTHEYDFNGSYADALSGPSMVPNGGSLTATQYVFDAGQGPNLSGAINAKTYSIEMLATITDVSGYRKLIDFKNRTDDKGLYDLGGVADFYGALSSQHPDEIVGGQPFHIVITRDDTTQQVIIYVNGVQDLTFQDSTEEATFTAANNIIHFMIDDTNQGYEQSAGSLDRIRIYDAPLTGDQVQQLYQGADPVTKAREVGVTLADGQNLTGQNFGVTTNILLAGNAYNDSNSNGLKDAGEAAIAGVVVKIISDGFVVATRTTDANGKWQVKGLGAGMGEADATVPSGYTPTYPLFASYGGSMSSGQQNQSLNFGLHKTGPAPAPTAAVAVLASDFCDWRIDTSDLFQE